MTADLQQVMIATRGGDEKPTTAKTATTTSASSPRKDAPNPQQGMADPAASVSATTAATVTNTACTSPLTVTSLEAAAAAGTAAAVKANTLAVPAVVSQVVPTVVAPQPTLAAPGSVEGLLAGPMANLGLGPAAVPPPQANAAPVMVPPPPPPPSRTLVKPAPQSQLPPRITALEKLRMRTPPTEHDNRKLFVGGLPCDVHDREFLHFFSQFGEVIDSVVMVDRITKRTRGFGFVTFKTEAEANALLTAIPGRTGYVFIKGKQCELKASTPKVPGEEPPKPKHGANQTWRGNHQNHNNHHHSGYGPHLGPNNNRGPPMHGRPGQPPTLGEKQFHMGQGFNGDIDGRNFDEVYNGGGPYGSHQGRPFGNQYSSSSMYNYQNYHAYGGNHAGGSGMSVAGSTVAGPGIGNYAYANDGATVSSVSSIPSNYDASMYGPYGPSGGASVASTYYDPYAAQGYPGQYGGSSYGHPAMLGGYGGYNNGGYYGEEAPGGTAGMMPAAPGVHGSDGGDFGYPQSYPGDGGDYNQAGAEQYE